MGSEAWAAAPRTRTEKLAPKGSRLGPQLLLGDLGQISWLLWAAHSCCYKKVATEMPKTLLMYLGESNIAKWLKTWDLDYGSAMF